MWSEHPPTAVEFLVHAGALRATYRFTNKGERDAIIRDVLEACPKDAFVAPATGKGSDDRIKGWGRDLVNADIFDGFVEQSFMRQDNTQTSDD